MESDSQDLPLIMKSHLINALLPKFLKHLFWNLVVFVVLFAFYKLIDFSANYNRDFEFILYGVLITILFSVFKILKDTIRIMNTSFFFYNRYLEIKFKLFHEKIHTVNYSVIQDIQIKKSLWDRMCGVGDIIIHTANDDYIEEDFKAIVLKDLRHTDKIQKQLNRRIGL